VRSSDVHGGCLTPEAHRRRAHTHTQAVAVSFEWDGVSDKTYAIMCEDYASESGYEYVDSNNPQLGDGSLIAKFSDGTVTSTDWKAYTVTFGPTDASVSAGCGTNNLGACQVQVRLVSFLRPPPFSISCANQVAGFIGR
jgi:hypothetical protein